MSTDLKAHDLEPKKKPAKRHFNPNRAAFIGKVRDAYEALQAKGDPAPSERVVRKKLGGGSPNDINAALKIIRGELWHLHEQVVYQTRYTSEAVSSTGTSAGLPIDDPTVGQ